MEAQHSRYLSRALTLPYPLLFGHQDWQNKAADAFAFAFAKPLLNALVAWFQAQLPFSEPSLRSSTRASIGSYLLGTLIHIGLC